MQCMIKFQNWWKKKQQKKTNGGVGDHIFIIILDDEIVIELNLNKFPRDIWLDVFKWGIQI